MESEAHPADPTPAACLLRLAPYLQSRIRRGVVGSSRYAQNLRRAIREAADDPRLAPVLISGEPGLEKDNIAALIHFGSAVRREGVASRVLRLARSKCSMSVPSVRGGVGRRGGGDRVR